MISESNYRRLEYWIEECQSKGKLAFNLAELRQSFQTDTQTALKRVLDRLSEKQKVVSIFKGYYIIIPPQYSSKGILPAAMFIDGLMKFLERKYYVAFECCCITWGIAPTTTGIFYRDGLSCIKNHEKERT